VKLKLAILAFIITCALHAADHLIRGITAKLHPNPHLEEEGTDEAQRATAGRNTRNRRQRRVKATTCRSVHG
jgi:hypothetical protein